VRQLNSMPVDFPVIGSGTGLHPFKSVTDYDNFLKRIDRFSIWVDTAIKNMRHGVEAGIVATQGSHRKDFTPTRRDDRR